MDDFDLDDILAPKRRRKKRDDDFLDDIFDEPSPGELRRMRAEERRSVSPEEEESILGKVGNATLSGLGWFGEVLDKYTGDRAMRGLLSGKPRELASIIPFSDDLGITSRDDLTTGEDLNKQWFGLEKDNSWTSMGAGIATEVGLGLLNPVSWIGSAAESLTNAGKVAQKAGLGADEIIRVANAKELNRAGKAGDTLRKIGGFESQMTTTLRDLINHTGSETADEIAEATKRLSEIAADSGHKLDDLLDEPLGHRLSVQIPFGENLGALPGFGAKDSLGLAAARGSDWLADLIGTPLTGLRSMFDPSVVDATTKGAQAAISPRTYGAWGKEGDQTLDAMQLMKLAKESGKSVDEVRDILSGAGDYFTGRKAPPGAIPAEPAVPAGHARVYHSGTEWEGGGDGRWVSTIRDYASNYRPDQPLHYLDLPDSDPRLNDAFYPDQGVRQGFSFNFQLTPEESAKLKQVARDPAGEIVQPWHLHGDVFKSRADTIRHGARPLAFGLENFMEEKAVEAFRKGEIPYEELQKQVPGLPVLSPDDIAQREEAITTAMGPWGKKHTDLVAENIDDATQEAIYSAEKASPGKIAKLRKWGQGEAYDKLKAENPVLYEEAAKRHKTNQKIVAQAEKEGWTIPHGMDSEEMFYSTRYATGLLGQSAEHARDLDLKHFPGGTTGLKNMLADVAQKGEGDVGKMKAVLESEYSGKLEQQIRNEARMEGKTITNEQVAEELQRRYKAMSESLGSLPAETRNVGVFGNHSALDALSYDKVMNGRLSVVQSFNDATARAIQPIVKVENGILKATGELVPKGQGVKLSELVNKLHLDPGMQGEKNGWLRAIYNRLGLSEPGSINHFEASKKALLNMEVPADFAKDLTRMHEGMKLTDNIQNVVNVWDSLTTLFKSFTLAHPSTKVRDLYAGIFHSFILGNASWEAVGEVKGLTEGAVSNYWKKLKPVQEILKRSGIDPATATAEQATDAFRTLAGSHDRLMQGQTSEIAKTGGATAEAMLDSRPGVTPKSIMGGLHDAASEYTGVGNLGRDLFTVEGVFEATKTKNPLVRASNYYGDWTDKITRLVPFVSMLEQGYSPAAAEARVMLQQIDYSGRALGRVEQTYLSKLFPFYKFSRGMAKQLVNELWEHPRGAMAAVIKAQAALARQDDDEFLPGHIRQTMAIPWGERNGNNQAFLTGLGLMHEDPFSLVRPGASAYDSVQGLLQELGGRAHPFLKAPAEVATGTQLYSGRNLQDLEGGLGRAIGNVTGSEKAAEVPILVEQLLSMSPFSRAVSTVRTAADPRKDLVQKMLNLSTGARVETVDLERSKQVEVRKLVNQLLRGEPGISAMETLYETPDSQLSPSAEVLMRFLRKHDYEQQRKKRGAKPKKDELEELLSL